MIEFSEFLSVFDYIKDRLFNNAIVRENYEQANIASSHYDDTRTYQFILVKNSNSYTKDTLLKVLQFFSSECYLFQGWSIIDKVVGKAPFKVFEYTDFESEYVIKITDVRAMKAFQMLWQYAKSIYNDTQKQDALMKAINLPTPEYEDDKKDFIDEFSFIFEDKDFVVEEVLDNEEHYRIKSENLIIQEMQKIDVNKKPILRLEYKRQELFLNDRLILKCQSCSGNDNILKFLIANPNETWTRNELNKRSILHTIVESNVNEYTKSFYTFLVDIKVSGKYGYNNIGNLFFGIDRSKNLIHLKNPIFEKDLKEHNIEFANEEELLDIMFQKKG